MGFVFISILCSLTTFVILYLYRVLIENNEFFVRRKVRFAKPKLLFGSSREFFFRKIELIDFIENLYNEMPKERISGFFHLTNPIFFLRDPKLYKLIAVKEFDSFMDHKFIIEPEMDATMGNTVFLMRGQRWRKMRLTLSPAFTGSKMRQMFELIRECATQTCEHLLRRENQNVNIEMKDFFCRFTNDVIASCAFGHKLNSFVDRDNEFLVTGRKLQYLSTLSSFLKILMLRSFPKLMKALDIEFLSGDVRKLFSDLVLTNLRSRQTNRILRPDLINILLQAKENSANGNGTKWTDEDLVSQSFIFYLAGFDTVMWLFVSFSYEIAIQKEIQDRLYEEVKETSESLCGESISYDALKGMKYMNMVLNEVLRKSSPGIFIDRLCTKQFSLKDGDLNITFEKGDHIWIPIYCFHHNPEYFPEPEKFDPERFSDENLPKIDPINYIPFGIGPRQCFGKRFAYLEVKLLMFYLIKSFSFNVSCQTEIPMKIESSPFGLAPLNGLHLILRRRHVRNESD